MQEKGGTGFAQVRGATLWLKSISATTGSANSSRRVYPGSRLGKHTPHSLYQPKFLDVKLFNLAHCRLLGRQSLPWGSKARKLADFIPVPLKVLLEEENLGRAPARAARQMNR